MIAGAHFIVYSKGPKVDRAFFKTALELTSIDLCESWLVLALPPAGLAVHPVEGESMQSEIGLYQSTHPTMVKPHST